MKFRNLGKSGLRISELGLGCNNLGAKLGPQEAAAIIHKALDVGVNFFDTADIYGNYGGSETILGDVLKARRDEIVLASKVGWPMGDERKSGGSRRYIMKAVDDSLRRLKTDRIDLYQFHRPDPLTPLEETVLAFEDLVRAGKILYWGCSNMPAWQIVEAQWIASKAGGRGMVSCQEELSLLIRKTEANIPMMDHFGLGLLPFYPLAAGMLTGKYQRGVAPESGTRLKDFTAAVHTRHTDDGNWPIIEKLTDFSRQSGHTMVEIAFGWLLSKKVVASVIAGASSPAQIEQNAKSLKILSQEEIGEIEKIINASYAETAPR